MKTDNEIIAEFMGANFVNDAPTEFPNGYYFWPNGDWGGIPELVYNESWDLLMPVVEKIELWGDRVEIAGLSCLITRNGTVISGVWDSSGNASKLDIVFRAVSAWVKDHNETKPADS